MGKTGFTFHRHHHWWDQEGKCTRDGCPGQRCAATNSGYGTRHLSITAADYVPPPRPGERCSGAAANADGLCGAHHYWKLRHERSNTA